MDSSTTQDEPETTMAAVDSLFQQLGCLGHGGFGSVFLAKKRSGRKVALKFMRIGLDDDEEEVHSSFTREVDAVLKLDCTEGSKDMSICYFRDWLRGPNFAAIVMQYADGGTLAQEIETREQPYTERRICWYALQLSEALAHAHSRGVFHRDVKATNVLIDGTGGGKLLLADFGSAVSPEEEGQSFTRLFAAPELQAAYERDNYDGLEPQKLDAFALGCILFELICCKRLCDFDGNHDDTLGQFISQQQSAGAALSLPAVRLPWLPAAEAGVRNENLGYSCELGYMIKNFLEPNPSARYAPSDLPTPLRGEQSPLLTHFCSAALTLQAGAPVTVDNIQLGMFVQRGQDWDDGDADGGIGSVGVVVKLDPDMHYTEVAFPCRANAGPQKPIVCRIGAGRKFELQVGPTPMEDFVEGSANTRLHGIIYNIDPSQYHVGQTINDNCTVVAVDHRQKMIAVAPMKRFSIPTQQVSPFVPLTGITNPRKPMSIPDTWNLDLGLLIPLESGEERQLVLDAFYSTERGGMNIQYHEIVKIEAVQSQPMWDAYAQCCEDIAMKNWSNPNQKRLFHGTGTHDPQTLLGLPYGFYQVCASVTASECATPNEILFSSAMSADRFGCCSADGNTKKIILSRVALGRIDVRCGGPTPQPPFAIEYHSIQKAGQRETHFSISNPFQAYPEFIITYKTNSLPGRRTVRARRLSRSPPNESVNNRSRRVPARPRQTPSPRTANSPMVSGQGPVVNTPRAAFSSRVVPPAAASTTPTTARSAEGSNTTPGGSVAPAKMCVVCWERPVETVMIPCGHPCLCEVCSTKQGLKKLNKRCPECRSSIRQCVKFYGKVVNEE